MLIYIPLNELGTTLWEILYNLRIGIYFQIQEDIAKTNISWQHFSYSEIFPRRGFDRWTEPFQSPLRPETFFENKKGHNFSRKLETMLFTQDKQIVTCLVVTLGPLLSTVLNVYGKNKILVAEWNWQLCLIVIEANQLNTIHRDEGKMYTLI